MKDAIIPEKQVEKELKRINLFPGGLELLRDKATFRILRLDSIRAPMANMIKEEMLGLGGDAAVHWQTIACKVEATDVITFGTIKQYKQFIEKMNAQPFEGKEIAKRVRKLLGL